MALEFTPPEIICFSKDRIIGTFEDDKTGIVPGLKAENTFVADGSGNIVDGSQLVFRWDDNEVRFTASDTAIPNGAQFPTYTYNIATQQEYIARLAPFFRANYFLAEDFVITASSSTITGPGGSFTLHYVKFEAKLIGKKFNFNVTRIGGGGLANLITGTDTTELVNSSVFLELWLLDQDDLNPERIFKGSIPLDMDSKATIDIAPLLHSFLTSEIPSFTLPVAQKCKDSRRKYFLKYASAGGENYIGQLTTTPNYVVLLGGFSEKMGAPQSVTGTFKNPVDTTDKLLMLQSKLRYVRQDQPVFISWVNFRADVKTVHASIDVVFSDGSKLQTNTNIVSLVGQYEKVMFGVGYNQLNLGILPGTVAEYTVRVRDDSGYVSETLRVIINYAHFEYIRYFAYVNSWGAMDTLLTYGKGSTYWKIFKESSEKVMPYTFNAAERQFVEWNQQYEEAGEVASGWIRKRELDNFLDLFISPVKFRVINGVAFAVAINSDTIARGSDGDNQHGVIFEYQFARRFDSLYAQELDDEDTSDYIPSNVLVAGNPLPVIKENPASNQSLRVIPYPVPGSKLPVESNGIYELVAEKQDKLPIGNADQYLRGDGQLKNMRQAVNAVEEDPTVANYAKTIDSAEKILNDLEAMNPGLNAKVFGGQQPEFYTNRMTHPAFNMLPRITVTKGAAFTKYLDLTTYKSSYHLLANLTLEINYNSLKSKGLEIIKDGLLLTLTGKFLDDVSLADDNILIYVTDNFGNQKTLTLRIGTLVEVIPDPDPEIPVDDRPDCPVGPDFYGTPIVLSNSSIQFGFDGVGVPIIRIKFYIPGVAVAIRGKDNDLLAPNNGTATRTITFEALPPGEYDMSIEGHLCRSEPDLIRIVIPEAETGGPKWSSGFPKHVVTGDNSSFQMKIDEVSGLYPTQIINMTTGTEEYNFPREYVAGVTIIDIPKTGGYADANYQINVGSLTASLKVGNPVETPTSEFLLRNNWNGSTIANLNLGNYEGPAPATGYNISLSSNNLGFLWTTAGIRYEKEIAGVFVIIPELTNTTYGNSIPLNYVIDKWRLFPTAGVDSRYVYFQNVSLNQYGKYRITYWFKNGDVETGTKTAIIQLSKLEIAGGYKDGRLGGSRYTPIVGRVLLNGLNVQNNNVWAEPFATWREQPGHDKTRTLEYTADNRATWNMCSTTIDAASPGDVSNIMLLNEGGVDQFPDGSTRTVILRIGSNHAIESAPYIISNGSGSDGGTAPPTVPSKDGTIKTKIDNAEFSVINARDMKITITPSKRVRLDYLLTRQSQAGNNIVNALLLDSTMNPVPEDVVTALRSNEGYAMHDCGVTFYLIYYNPNLATTIDQIYAKFWEMFGNRDVYMNNSYRLHYCILEIKGLGSGNSANEVRENAGIFKAAWYPQALLLDYTNNFPPLKYHGVTKRVDLYPPSQVLRKANAIQARYDDVNNGLVPFPQEWMLGDKNLVAAQKGDAHYDFTGTINPGQTIVLDASGLNVITTDILSDTYRGYNGKVEGGGISVDPSIVENGKIRYTVHNGGSNPVKLSEGYFRVYYFRNTDEIADRFYGAGARALTVSTAEFVEGGLPGYHAEEVFRKVYELQKSRDGITSVLQNRLIGDYFQNNYGKGTFISTRFSRGSRQEFRDMMASETAARHGSGYYDDCYQYRHRIINGYIDGVGRMLDGAFLWDLAFNLENNYIAMPDRYVFVWGWFSFEGVNLRIDETTEQRLPIASPSGDLIRLSRAQGSYEIGKQTVFLSLAIGQGTMSWHDTVKMGVNPDEWGLPYIGGGGPGSEFKTNWQPTGGDVVQWDPNNPTHARRIEPAKGNGWTDTAAPSHNGEYAGADIFCQVANRMTTSLRYPNFSYVENGVAKTGYFDGNAPVNGALGNSEVSRLFARNIGQHNNVNCAEYKKPYIHWGEGPGGRVAYVINQNAGIDGVTTYTINENGTHTFTHRGTGLGVYAFD